MKVFSSTPQRPADNPFASHRIEGLRYRANHLDLAALCRRLEQIGGRAAIVGHKGTGKTTLLDALADALPDDPILVRIRGDCANPWRTVRARLPKAVVADHVVLIDGAERLGPVAWLRLLRHMRLARFVIVTSHRPGRLPTLIECQTDLDLLRDLVHELAPADAQILTPVLEEIFHRHRGNIRSCLRELYDVYAGRISVEF